MAMGYRKRNAFHFQYKDYHPKNQAIPLLVIQETDL
jgi:hypothetical protein